jgi:formate dehydrogenase maturation protein FdhE
MAERRRDILADQLTRLAGAAEVEVGEIRLPAHLVRARLAAGIPLIDRVTLPMPATVGGLFERLTEALLPEPGARQVLDALRSHRLHAEQLVGEAVVGHEDHLEQLAASAGVPPAIVRSLADVSARPFLQAVARRLAPALALAPWDRTYCPICGGLPIPETDIRPRPNEHGVARVRCARCETPWAWALQDDRDDPAPRDERVGAAGYRLEHGDPEGEGFDDD